MICVTLHSMIGSGAGEHGHACFRRGRVFGFFHLVGPFGASSEGGLDGFFVSLQEDIQAEDLPGGDDPV